MAAKRVRCPHCGSDIPNLVIEPAELERIMARMPHSPSMVVGELGLFGECTQIEAKQWLDHLLACCRSWPFADEDAAVLVAIDAAFAGVECPALFCELPHCDETADHNAALTARTTINIRRQDLGVTGWDPISFTDPPGRAYLFPALARYALMPASGDHYAQQLAWHLGATSGAEKFHAWCDRQQRTAVYMLLQRILESKSAPFEFSSDGDQLLAAIERWSAV